MRTGLFGLLLLLAVGPARSALADYCVEYARGVQAVERGQWQRAVLHLRQAIAAQPQAGGPQVMIYGLRYEPYVPYYFLGLALRKAGRPAEALDVWQHAVDQGVADSTAYAEALHAGLEEVRRQVGSGITPEQVATITGLTPEEFGRYLSAAEFEVAHADTAQQQLEELTGSPRGRETLAADAELARLLAETAATLEEVRQQLAEGRSSTDLAAVLAARDRAMQARQESEALRTRLLEQIGQVAAGVTPTPPLPSPTPTPVPSPTPLPRRQSTPLPPVPAPDGGDEPPTELVAAAEAYFSGEYREAISLLDNVHFHDARAEAQASLLQAAAWHALYLLGNRQEDDLRQRAREAARRCRLLNRTLEPSLDYFSPEFARLFDQVAAEIDTSPEGG